MEIKRNEKLINIELYYYEWDNGKARSPLYANRDECITDYNDMIKNGVLKYKRVEIKSIILFKYDLDAINKEFYL